MADGCEDLVKKDGLEDLKVYSKILNDSLIEYCPAKYFFILVGGNSNPDGHRKKGDSVPGFERTSEFLES